MVLARLEQHYQNVQIHQDFTAHLKITDFSVTFDQNITALCFQYLQYGVLHSVYYFPTSLRYFAD